MIAFLLAVIAALGSLTAAPAATAIPDAAQSSQSASSARSVPSKAQWLGDVHAVLADAPAYVQSRAAAASPDERLALNLDIDNTSIASYFGGGPIRETLALSRLAQRQGVAVLFNTARDGDHRARTLAQLKAAGYRVDGLCMRNTGETKVHSKQRCRSQYAAAGYTLIANLGNNPTDFAGQGYERAFRLPNYDGQLP